MNLEEIVKKVKREVYENFGLDLDENIIKAAVWLLKNSTQEIPYPVELLEKVSSKFGIRINYIPIEVEDNGKKYTIGMIKNKGLLDALSYVKRSLGGLSDRSLNTRVRIQKERKVYIISRYN